MKYFWKEVGARLDSGESISQIVKVLGKDYDTIYKHYKLLQFPNKTKLLVDWLHRETDEDAGKRLLRVWDDVVKRYTGNHGKRSKEPIHSIAIHYGIKASLITRRLKEAKLLESLKPWAHLLVETDSTIRDAERAWLTTPTDQNFIRLRREYRRAGDTQAEEHLIAVWRKNTAETVNRKNVERFSHNHTFHHLTERDSRGAPARARVTGKVKLWKRRPDEFKLPVKHGLKDSFYITRDNGNVWATDDSWFRAALPGDD
jgi:hypothetical protein